MSGILLGFFGLVLILAMSLPLLQRLVISAAWAIHLQVERRRMRHGYARYSRFRVSAGGVLELQDSGGEWVSGQLLEGSVVLRKLAWLRIRTEHGERFAELLAATTQSEVDWRRLQVIWRHIGAAA